MTPAQRCDERLQVTAHDHPPHLPGPPTRRRSPLALPDLPVFLREVQRVAPRQLIVSVPNRPGAVHDILVPLKQHGVSMTRFESRPARSGPWEYYFYIDLQGHPSQPHVAAALKHYVFDKDNVLTLHFTLPLQTAVDPGTKAVTVDVYDPSFFVAFGFAEKAPVKMLFPLVFLVLPAFLLLTVVPVLLSTLRSIR